MVVWRGVQGGYGVFFQTCNRTHSNRLSVIDSPQCLGDGVLKLVISFKARQG